MSELVDMLVRHEGMRLLPYTDSVGKLTIGVGRNLTDVGLRADEAEYLLMNDVEAVVASLRRTFYWYGLLNAARQDALADMCFNLGLTRFQTFEKMIAAIEAARYAEAATEMLDSKWATQVGGRATELAAMMRTGTYQPPAVEV